MSKTRQPAQKVTDNFSAVTAALEKMLRPYAKKLIVTSTTPMSYSLSTQHVLPNKQTLFFAGFQRHKRYISYYLMPVYMFPELLTGMSVELRKRMQGKSCFNFKDIDPVIFRELTLLTRAGFERFKQKGLLK